MSRDETDKASRRRPYWSFSAFTVIVLIGFSSGWIVEAIAKGSPARITWLGALAAVIGIVGAFPIFAMMRLLERLRWPIVVFILVSPFAGAAAFGFGLFLLWLPFTTWNWALGLGGIPGVCLGSVIGFAEAIYLALENRFSH